MPIKLLICQQFAVPGVTRTASTTTPTRRELRISADMRIVRRVYRRSPVIRTERSAAQLAELRSYHQS